MISRSAGVVSLMLAVAATPACAAGLSEYQIKAAYILNFARFIEWPDAEIGHGAIVVGVLGIDPFGEILDSTLIGKTVHGHPLTVHRFRSAQEIDACHLLFISSSEAARVKSLVQYLSKTPILTISDCKGFTDSGGAIGFVIDDSRVRFDINLQAIASARLKASAQLLEVARTLRGAPK